MFIDKPDNVIKLTIILSSIAISCLAGLTFWLFASMYSESLKFIILSASVGAYMWDKWIESAWEKVLTLISKK